VVEVVLEVPALLHLEVLDTHGRLLVIFTLPVVAVLLAQVEVVQEDHHVLVVMVHFLQLIVWVEYTLEVEEEEVLEDQRI
jgi:hypothetical protein